MKLLRLPRCLRLLLAAACLLAGLPARAQVPPILSYQGRIAVGAVNFDGSGQFRFALVNSTGTSTFWSNDDTSTAGSPPASAVALTVTKGLYSVLLGDVSLPGMTVPIPASAFNQADVRLRIWFDDGVHGSQLLTPDQRSDSGFTWTLRGVVWGGVLGRREQIGRYG